MNFNNLSYVPGQLVAAIVPCHSSDGSIHSCEAGNGGGTRHWQTCTHFKLLEGRLSYVQPIMPRGSLVQHAGEIGMNFRLGLGQEWTAYWVTSQSSLENVLRNIAANPVLSREAKEFVMKYSIPRLITAPGYDQLLKDIARAAGVTGVVTESLLSLREEAQRHGVILMSDDERGMEGGLGLAAGTGEQLSMFAEDLLASSSDVASDSPVAAGAPVWGISFNDTATTAPDFIASEEPYPEDEEDEL